MKLGISKKLWIAIIVIVFLSGLFNYGTTLIIYEHFYVDQTRQQLEEKGNKVAELYHGGEITREFRDKVELLNEISNEEIVIADDKEALGDCLPVNYDDSSPFTDEQLDQLYSGETVTIIGEHTSCKKDVIAVAVPLISNNTFVGAIFVYTPLATVDEAVSEIRIMLFGYIVLFLLFGIIVGKIITNRVTKPLRQMEIAARKMMDGDFNTKIDIHPDKEISSLCETFNHLSDSLRETIGLLSKEKKQLAQILDGIRDGVITIDLEGNLILCNCSTLNLLGKLGLEKDEFIRLDIIQSYIRRVFNKKEIVVNEFEYKGKVFLIYVAPLIEDEQLWGAVLVIHDITEERLREKETREFLAIVSHELRTPLSYMKGYTEALIDGVAQSKDTQDRYLDTIYKETERMERLVNDLLDLAKLERGTSPMESEEILLTNIIQQVVERYRNIYDKKGVKIECLNHSNQELWMLGDEDRIIQVLVNLLDNALRYTPTGGKVLVETDLLDNEILLKVTDTGEGIDSQYLDKIGEKFFRVDKSRTRKSGGVGLGMAIVKQIIEKLNGRLEIESKLKVGTTFKIYFPCKKNKCS